MMGSDIASRDIMPHLASVIIVCMFLVSMWIRGSKNQ